MIEAAIILFFCVGLPVLAAVSLSRGDRPAKDLYRGRGPLEDLPAAPVRRLESERVPGGIYRRGPYGARVRVR